MNIIITSSVIPMKSQYVKTTIKAGQTFRILAVFEDDRSRNQKNTSTSSNASTSGQTDREKIRGRYVQILSETRQVMIVDCLIKVGGMSINKSNIEYVMIYCREIRGGFEI